MATRPLIPPTAISRPPQPLPERYADIHTRVKRAEGWLTACELLLPKDEDSWSEIVPAGLIKWHRTAARFTFEAMYDYLMIYPVPMNSSEHSTTHQMLETLFGRLNEVIQSYLDLAALRVERYDLVMGLFLETSSELERMHKLRPTDKWAPLICECLGALNTSRLAIEDKSQRTKQLRGEVFRLSLLARADADKADAIRFLLLAEGSDPGNGRVQYQLAKVYPDNYKLSAFSRYCRSITCLKPFKDNGAFVKSLEQTELPTEIPTIDRDCIRAFISMRHCHGIPELELIQQCHQSRSTVFQELKRLFREANRRLPALTADIIVCSIAQVVQDAVEQGNTPGHQLAAQSQNRPITHSFCFFSQMMKVIWEARTEEKAVLTALRIGIMFCNRNPPYILSQLFEDEMLKAMRLYIDATSAESKCSELEETYLRGHSFDAHYLAMARQAEASRITCFNAPSDKLQQTIKSKKRKRRPSQELVQRIPVGTGQVNEPPTSTTTLTGTTDVAQQIDTTTTPNTP